MRHILRLLFLISALYTGAGERPKIGLALSGGGARGGAHVGVLRVLEEYQIPIDYIAGTSMGAVVGGLYAAGLSPDELAAQLSDTDWEEVFNDGNARADTHFRRKQEEREDLFAFDLGLNASGFKIGSGLIQGRKLSMLLRAETLHLTGLTRFDQLPIPFQAVATDLTTGSAVVLDQGDLVQAIRASMAIPGVFRPVAQNGRILVDGGVVQNLPVETLRAMGADIIIAVDVSTPPGDSFNDPNAVTVAKQSVELLSYQNIAASRALMTEQDILLTPNLDDLAAFDFPKLQAIMLRGEEVARADGTRLKALGAAQAGYQQWQQTVREFGQRRLNAFPIGVLKIVGPKRIDPKRLVFRLETSNTGPLNLEALARDLTWLETVGEFQSVDFHLQNLEPALYQLTIEAEEDERGPGYLRLGLRLTSELEDNGAFTLLANYRRTMLNQLGAEWKNRIAFGDIDLVDSEFYQPLGLARPWFVAARGIWRQDQDETLVGGDTQFTATTRHLTGHGDVGLHLGHSAEVRLGVYRGSLDIRADDPSFMGPHSIDLGGVSLRIRLDTMDRAVFPREGVRATVDMTSTSEGLGADDAYDRLALEITRALSLGRSTWVGTLHYADDLDSDLPIYDRFQLGGPFRLSGLSKDALQGQRAGLARLLYYRRLSNLPKVLGLGFYVGAGFEAGNVWQGATTASLDDLRTGGTIFVGAETLLGPMHLAFGRTGNEDTFHFVLGHTF